MNFTIIKKLPHVSDIIQAHPLSDAAYERVARDIREVKEILAGRDKRMLIIVGPCSAWPYEATLEFARRLVELDKGVRDSLKIVMRTYIQKPRTTKGWTGPVNQPDPFSESDIGKGITYARSLMVQIIEMGLPIADEMVFTHNAKGFNELLSWVAVGARSTEDQEHRVFASAVGCPVGMKNPTSGVIELGVNSVVAAQHEHIAVFDGHQVETHGNPFAHLVLRGGLDRPNYFLEDLLLAQKLLTQARVSNPAVIIDASHDNCRVNGGKDARQQINVVHDVLKTLTVHPELRSTVKGFMLECFLKGGAQKVESLTPETIDLDGLSITDPCLSWEETATLLTDLAQKCRALS